jgi:hypothetical protein
LGIANIIVWILAIKLEPGFSNDDFLKIIGLIALSSFIGLIFGIFLTWERRAIAKWGIVLCSIALFLSFVIWFLANLIVPW